MSKNLQRNLISVMLIIGYVTLGLLGENGKLVYELLGNFAVGWLIWDLADNIVGK
jgi:hypothetical protein